MNSCKYILFILFILFSFCLECRVLRRGRMASLWYAAQNLSSSSNKTPKVYVFLTDKEGYRTFFLAWTVLIIVLGIMLNALILTVTTQQKATGQENRLRHILRKQLVHYFIFNLAVSDIIASLIAIPLLILDLIFDFSAKNNFVCKIVRFLQLLFPTTTLFLLLVITVERFLSLVLPIFLLNRSTARRIVFLSWIWSMLVVCLGIISYNVQRSELDNNYFTLVCKYSGAKHGVNIENILYLVFLCFAYLIPCVVIVNMSIYIAYRIWITRLVPRGELPAFDFVSEREKQKTTKLLLSVVAAFVLPYLAYIIYGMLRTTNKLPDISSETDYILRHFFATLAYSNVVVNPIVIIMQMKSLRVRLRVKFGFTQQVIPKTNFIPMVLPIESSLPTVKGSYNVSENVPEHETHL